MFVERNKVEILKGGSRVKDALIVRYIKKKKEKGMDMLIDNYRGLITSVERKHLGTLQNYEEECVNDVLLLIWNNIESFDKGKNELKNWVCAIAKHKAIDYKRKYIKNVNTQTIESNISYIDKNLMQREIEEEIEEMLSYLNERDKDLFRKYYLENFDLEEIAMDTNTQVSNLYNRLSRGRKKIKENCMKKEV